MEEKLTALSNKPTTVDGRLAIGERFQLTLFATWNGPENGWKGLFDVLAGTLKSLWVCVAVEIRRVALVCQFL